MSRRIVLLLAVVLGAAVIAWAVREDDGGRTPTTSTTTLADSTATTRAVVGTAGAAGVGDPYFPGLGNGGYDVDHYDLELEWLPDDGAIEGAVTITATAGQDLSRFNLDLAGLEVRSVTIDGSAAQVNQVERELEVTPAEPVAEGHTFTTVVTYGGVPRPLADGTDLFEVGWQTDGREAFVVSEPAGAATFYPVNDHPTDKATYTFRIQAPPDQVVVANGLLVGEPELTDEGGGRIWTYEARDPMASYLVQIAIGDYELVEAGTFEGVTIRHAFHRSVADAARRTTERTIEMIDLLDDVWGAYPFEAYGVLAVDEALGFALETQTLTIIGTDTALSGREADEILLHELSHQWVGDAVSPATWKDIWLNEGFATYSQWLWSERTGGATAARRARSDVGPGLDTPPGDPGTRELFQNTVYLRGGMTLQALREAIGDDAFFTVLRSWIDEHRDSAASTADFIALSERVSGRQLDELFDEWLYAPERPRLD
ncbi:MAG: M1 family metallopeptidase [Acidimicrobiales bacterium]